MLNILFCRNLSEEKAEEITGKKYLWYPNDRFMILSKKHDLYNDEKFKQFLLEIDKSDIPMPGVVRYIPDDSTHPISEVSTGVMMMWLMYYYPDNALYPSQYFGPNCYQTVFDIGKEKDVYVYDDADIYVQKVWKTLVGQFRDPLTGRILDAGREGHDYSMTEGNDAKF